MMRIALAGISDASGIDTYTRLLASGLDRAGHDVLLFRREDSRVANLPPSIATVSLPRTRHRWLRYAGAFEAHPLQRTVREHAGAWGADVVHATSCSLAPGRWSRLVVNAWDPERGVLTRARLARARRQRPWPEALHAASDRLAWSRASAIVAVTKALAEAVRPHYRRVEWLPPFVPDDAIEQRHGRRGGDCVMVANYLDHPRKNLDVAVEAVRIVRQRRPDVRLVLVGGWLADERRRALPGHCDVAGRLSSSDVATVLSEAGCCLLPSVWEEFGYAGLEALARGSPLVCGPLPAFEDFSEGVVVSESLHPKGFARAVESALDGEPFVFPSVFRESTVVPRIVALYRSIP